MLCLQDKMLSMAVANHVLWPLAKFVNAKLVPKKHQPVANKVVQVCQSTCHDVPGLFLSLPLSLPLSLRHAHQDMLRQDCCPCIQLL